jgi:hypothetical protein
VAPSSARSRPNQQGHLRRRRLRWLVRLWRSNPAATWTSAIATVVFGVATLWVTVLEPSSSSTIGGGTRSGDPGGSTVPRLSSASPPNARTLTITPLSPSFSQSLGRCANLTTASPTDCSTSTAWLSVNASPCTVETLLGIWGMDQELTSLLVVVKPAGNQCWATPAPEALDAGGRARDLVQVSASSVPTVLRSCARGQMGHVTVSCSQVHELEWVGGWQSPGRDDPADRCHVLGRRYTNSSLADVAGRVEELAIQGHRNNDATVYRCALRVRATSVTGSLYNNGDGPLDAQSR